MTFEDSGLAAGSHYATINFTSPDTGQSFDVRVSVTVGSDQKLYLPVVLRKPQP